MHCPDKLPDWFKLSARNAKFKLSEVASLFGYTEGGLWCSVHEGRFPPPDARTKGIVYRACFWNRDTLIKEFKRRKAIHAKADASPRTVAQVLQITQASS